MIENTNFGNNSFQNEQKLNLHQKLVLDALVNLITKNCNLLHLDLSETGLNVEIILSIIKHVKKHSIL